MRTIRSGTLIRIGIEIPIIILYRNTGVAVDGVHGRRVNAECGANVGLGIDFLEPDVGEGREWLKAAAASRVLDHPLGVHASERRTSAEVDGVAVVLAQVVDRTRQRINISMREGYTIPRQLEGVHGSMPGWEDGLTWYRRWSSMQ